MSEIIFHNYPQSPVAEKVRKAFGIKGLDWNSVEIPRLPPKPDLMPLTGGYRRTPVMQIGADIYCDSQCILMELQRRFPEPDFQADWGLCRWNDQVLFDLAVRLVLGGNADVLPEDFARDRGRLYFGPNPDLHKVAEDLPHVMAQLRGALGWWQNELINGGSFLAGQRAGLADVLAWYLVWFIRGRWKGGPELIAPFSEIVKWEARMDAIGYGTSHDMTATQALEIARKCDTACAPCVDDNDPQGLKPGQQVWIRPDSDGGDPAVEGLVHYADHQTISILRDDSRVGQVCVHFPRIGYRVSTG